MSTNEMIAWGVYAAASYVLFPMQMRWTHAKGIIKIRRSDMNFLVGMWTISPVALAAMTILLCFVGIDRLRLSRIPEKWYEITDAVGKRVFVPQEDRW